MRRLSWVVIVTAVLFTALSLVQVASAQSFPYCEPGKAASFESGFKALSDALGETMGEPVECEHAERATGDALQQTTTGLSFYRRSTNIPTFTNGWEHWGLTAILVPTEAAPPRSTLARAGIPSQPPAAPRNSACSDTGALLLLADRFFLAESVVHQADGSLIVQIRPKNSEETAALRALRPDRFQGPTEVRFAYQEEGARVRVESVESESVRGQTVFSLS